MRSNFCADWAFGIRGAIENTVRRAFPSEIRLWPILQAFNFEAYAIGDRHFVMVLRDKLSGIPTGPGEPNPFPHSDHPSLPPSIINVDQWLSYLARKFDLRNEDIAMILPIHDSGRHDSAADFDMFTAEERQLWNHQFNLNMAKQMAAIGTSSDSTSSHPVNVTYNVSGTNARVNINSADTSINTVSSVPAELFCQMLEAVRGAAAESSARTEVERSILDMEAGFGKGEFGNAYKAFMAVFADHIQVFGPILAAYLPALAKILA